MEIDNNKVNKSNKLLVVLVSIMSVVTLATLSALGFVFYKGYAEKNTNQTIIDSDESTLAIEELYTYYFATSEYVEKYGNYATAVYPIVKSSYISDEDKTKVANLTNDFIFYSQSFSAQPVTHQDYLFEEHFSKLQMSAEQFADYIKEYLYKEETVYLTFIKNSFSDTRIHLDTMNEFRKQNYN